VTLPSGCLKRPHWRDAGWAVMKAADSGRADDIKAATELIVRAFEHEGWLQLLACGTRDGPTARLAARDRAAAARLHDG
jgi:hypothetical protein